MVTRVSHSPSTLPTTVRNAFLSIVSLFSYTYSTLKLNLISSNESLRCFADNQLRIQNLSLSYVASSKFQNCECSPLNQNSTSDYDGVDGAGRNQPYATHTENTVMNDRSSYQQREYNDYNMENNTLGKLLPVLLPFVLRSRVSVSRVNVTC